MVLKRREPRWYLGRRGVRLLVPMLWVVAGPHLAAAGDPWLLWTGPTQLRGANIYQRRVYPELDGTELMGPGPIGPPYVQADFDRLAALGANYVNISHTGLYTQKPPYRLDTDARDNLDRLLGMARRAGLFAVISFRSGPGRSDFSVCCFGETWYDPGYLNDEVWRDQAAQDAWVAMWRATAQRYAGNPAVVGYDLMVEPNSNDVWFDEWDPEAFYATHAGTTYDWNQLYPRIIAAIREVDATMPILVGGMGYSGVDWLPYMRVVADRRTIYAVHQYAPHDYTHQEPPPTLSYPGTFDADGDGAPETVDRSWLESLLATVDSFAADNGVVVAVNEMGVMRWEQGADQYLSDEIDLLERRGLNWAVWAWEPEWPPWVQEVTAFNFRLGPDPANHQEVPGNALEKVLTGAWARNTLRPLRLPLARRPRGRVVPLRSVE
ncbi:MAG: glycoside hydrolase family 5 protein [Acidobacteria bacterium]|nr:glycoside hydrolase family 5 protein [Acidobacteriota bacterium]